MNFLHMLPGQLPKKKKASIMNNDERALQVRIGKLTLMKRTALFINKILTLEID